MRRRATTPDRVSQKPPRRRRWAAATLAVLSAGALLAGWANVRGAPPPPAPPPPTRLGINLFGIAPFNRQPAFANMIAQSEWMSSFGAGWTAMPAAQIDEEGWITDLAPGQAAMRPLVLPPIGSGVVTVRCTFVGSGTIAVGGLAQERSRTHDSLTFDLAPTGAPDEGAWVALERTDPRDPVRGIDCRDVALPMSTRFHPDLLALLEGFHAIRFLDWQRVNENAAVDWHDRPKPSHSSQASIAGVSVEDMVDLANLTRADPWFLIPYKADDAYITAFARAVHDRVDPARTVYVELGNEVWNEMFDAAQQARREGLARNLGRGDPMRAQMLRYAEKTERAMRIWTGVFADRPERLVRVASAQNAWPDLAKWVLGHGDVAAVIDALATAPYIWIDLNDRDAADVDEIFARMPAAIDDAIASAQLNRSVAAAYGKRFIAYEGGQHLLTPDMELARRLQRDPRMATAYNHYLRRWRGEIGDQLMLYASTAPIADYGSWGLREYAGQPIAETPKLRAVRAALGAAR